MTVIAHFMWRETWHIFQWHLHPPFLPSWAFAPADHLLRDDYLPKCMVVGPGRPKERTDGTSDSFQTSTGAAAKYVLIWNFHVWMIKRSLRVASFRDGDAKRLDFLVDLNILTIYALFKILLSQKIFIELAKCHNNVMQRSCRKNWWASR